MISEPAGCKAVPLGRFAAELKGLDLSGPISSEVATWLRWSSAKYQVLVVRNQRLGPHEQLAFTECFGQLNASLAARPGSHQVPQAPGLLYLSNQENSDTADYGMGWHSDGLAYARRPHGVTVLHCLECPQGVGATAFSSQYYALHAVPVDLRRAIEDERWLLPAIPFTEVPPGQRWAQPFIRTHSLTNKQFLYLATAATDIVGMPRAQSQAIMEALRSHRVPAESVYLHEWVPGDVVVWENCALLHTRADRVDPKKHGLRVMHRSATLGDFTAEDVSLAGVAG